jgi:hypothetical protein
MSSSSQQSKQESHKEKVDIKVMVQPKQIIQTGRQFAQFTRTAAMQGKCEKPQVTPIVCK